MSTTRTESTVDHHVLGALQRACDRVAPVWPLDRFVAVNPYLGLADHRFVDAAELLASAAGARPALPADFYLAAIEQGRIRQEDLAAALAAHDDPPAAAVDDLIRQVRADHGPAPARVPTVARVAAVTTGRDWLHLLIDRVSAWAAAYFDCGQAMWRSADRSASLFASWKEEAEVDRTPEVMGLRGFRAVVRSLPADPVAAAAAALAELGIPQEARELYLLAVLHQVGGWAAHTARIGFEHRLHGRVDDTSVQFLAVLLCWEVALARTLAGTGLPAAWQEATATLAGLGSTPPVRAATARAIVLQDAFDRSEQRRLIDLLAARPASPPPAGRPEVQAVFCIDVRSEVIRRHLEAVGEGVRTVGFAGFFGVPIEYVPIAHSSGDAQCPVLLTPTHTVPELLPDPTRHARAVEARRLSQHVKRAWKSFKMGAISCFSFVGPVGLAYLPKLFTDASGRTRPVPRPDADGLSPSAVATKGPSLTPRRDRTTMLGIPLEARVELAEGTLRAMSLTDGFAPLVLITGHGSTTVNNPYDAGLDCGACGGHAGEANARVTAAILNDPDVRTALAGRGIVIPDDTWFVAGQHDTTTDDVALFDRDAVPASHAHRLAVLDAQLTEASRRTRRERAGRLGIEPGAAIDEAVIRRSTDWAQVRPEWGLAGCRAFIVAPRHRTAGVDLGGWSFLHSYDWRQDEGFGVLELIMTAPMVVASWINLQYYASTVDNRRFGSGNKTLHNVVGRMGVLEGNGGDLRVGLPWQSVHDGERYQHEPLRLQVVIEAPIEAVNDVLARHPTVRDLCDHGWVHLLAMDDQGSISHRYAGGLCWEAV